MATSIYQDILNDNLSEEFDLINKLNVATEALNKNFDAYFKLSNLKDTISTFGYTEELSFYLNSSNELSNQLGIILPTTNEIKRMDEDSKKEVVVALEGAIGNLGSSIKNFILNLLKKIGDFFQNIYKKIRSIDTNFSNTKDYSIFRSNTKDIPMGRYLIPDVIDLIAAQSDVKKSSKILEEIINNPKIMDVAKYLQTNIYSTNVEDAIKQIEVLEKKVNDVKDLIFDSDLLTINTTNNNVVNKYQGFTVSTLKVGNITVSEFSDKVDKFFGQVKELNLKDLVERANEVSDELTKGLRKLIQYTFPSDGINADNKKYIRQLEISTKEIGGLSTKLVSFLSSLTEIQVFLYNAFRRLETLRVEIKDKIEKVS